MKFAFLSMLAFMLWSDTGFCKCSQPAEVWMDKIVAIENREALPNSKIAQLELLKSSYENCMNEEDSIYARIFHRLGDLYRVTGDFDKGIRYTRKAITINRTRRSSSQPSFLAHSYFNLGLYYILLNLLDEAHKYLDSCIAITVQYPEKKFLAVRAYEQKAFSYFITGDYQRSIEVSDYGLLQAKELQDTEFEALLLMQKAQANLELNQLSEAEDNIQVAINILSKPDMPLEYLAIGYSVYAHVLKQKKDFNASNNYYRKAYEINFQENNLVQSAKDLSDLGLLYDKDLNDPANAIDLYSRSLQLIRKTEDLYQQALVYNNIGRFYWGQHDYSTALRYFQKGLTILPIGFTDTTLQSNPNSDMLKLVTQNNILSILLANKGESLLELYKEELNKDYLFYAVNTFKAADRVIDQMRWKQLGQQSKLFWRENTSKLYDLAIETCYLLQDMESAFFFFEKSRAVMLNDKLSELGAQQYLSKETLMKEQRLRIKLFSLQQQMASLKESDTLYRQVSLQWFETQDLFEKFIRNLEISYPTYYQYKYDRSSYTIPEIRSYLLENQQSLIEYFNGGDHIYILTITPDTATLTQIEANINHARAEQLLMLCADRALLNQKYGQYRQLAVDLYENIFKPLSIKTERVIISPDEYFIPFETLLTDRASPISFLIYKYAFSYTYSAGYLMKNFREQNSVNSTMLGIAPINYYSYLKQSSLEGADFSLENIKSYFSQAKFLIRETATKKEFLKNLPYYEIIHLYSHAEADSSGKEPILYLHDSTLQVSELQLLGNLSAQLIVLSACNTATGKNVRGEGVFSLARGFAAAGIPSSITTLWQIDNQTTYQLDELFYKYLSQGLSLDKALREAKLEFLRVHDKAYELPYFWAPNILIGKTEIIFNDKVNFPASIQYIIAGALLSICVISVFLYHRNKRRSITSDNSL